MKEEGKKKETREQGSKNEVYNKPKDEREMKMTLRGKAKRGKEFQ